MVAYRIEDSLRLDEILICTAEAETLLFNSGDPPVFKLKNIISRYCR